MIFGRSPSVVFACLLLTGLTSLPSPGKAAEAPPEAAQALNDGDAPSPNEATLEGQAAAAQNAAEPELAALDEPFAPPTYTQNIPLDRMLGEASSRLYGIRHAAELEFTIPRDRWVPSAQLKLQFTPSPALLPRVSHLLVFLNEELMGTVPIHTEPPGQRQTYAVPLDPDYLSTYNRVRIEFVGHYTDICEDLAHTSLWLDLGQRTEVELLEEMIPMANDLAFFPEPFFDRNHMFGQKISFVFAGSPDLFTQEAAGILASYFGTRAEWRDLSFGVQFNELPESHAIVLATNDTRPEFLADFPAVDAPVIAMIDHPDNPYYKLLLVLGQEPADLKTAAQALAAGTPILRGSSVTVDWLEPLEPRKPYDAPNWIPTDREVFFAELVQYPGQLQVTGLRPRSINLPLRVPPDLFVWRSKGIPLNLLYRYTPPITRDESRLTLALNDRFVAGYPLEPHTDSGAITRLRLDVVGSDVADVASLRIPALRVGGYNDLQLDFSFASTVGNASADTCRTTLPVDTRAIIDGRSSINFSGYPHYIEMPNLHVFGSSGFPFSRMADLSETVVVMPEAAAPHEVELLLQVLGMIGAHTGYPAYGVELVNDWTSASERDKDILWLGETPEEFRERPDANLLLNHTNTWLTLPVREQRGEWTPPTVPYLPGNETMVPGQEAWRVDLRGVAPIAAIVGMASPWQPERSMVGLLASTPSDYTLLVNALQDSGKRDAMSGSVVTIRTSGVWGEEVGPRYFVGDLSWWQRLWYHLSDKPWLLAALTAVVVFAVGVLIWIILGRIARRRLNMDA